MDTKKVGQFLKDQRIAKKLNHAQLAEELDFSKRNIWRIEAGEPVRLKTYLKILGYFGYTLQVTKINE